MTRLLVIIWNVTFLIVTASSFSLLRGNYWRIPAYATKNGNDDGVGARFDPHHIAIKVRQIERSIAFYSLFGFKPSTRFRTGAARAVWLERSQNGSCVTRLELIEVPSFMGPEAIDLAEEDNVAILGLNHLAFDVSDSASHLGGLAALLTAFNLRSEDAFKKSIRLVHPPRQQMIGQQVWEVCFIADPDGVSIELLARNGTTLKSQMEPDWV